MTVLLTRPADRNAEIAERLAAQGIPSVFWPLMRIVPLADTCEVPRDTQALLVTSGNAIRVFAEISVRRDLPVLAVGHRTAEIARSLGFEAVQSADGDAGALASLARGSGYRKLLHLRGREVDQSIGSLLGKDHHVDEAILYGTEPTGLPDTEVQAALSTGEIKVLTIWSRRNAELLKDHLAANPVWVLSECALVAISAQAIEPLKEINFAVHLPANAPNAEEMVAMIVAAVRQKIGKA